MWIYLGLGGGPQMCKELKEWKTTNNNWPRGSPRSAWSLPQSCSWQPPKAQHPSPATDSLACLGHSSQRSSRQARCRRCRAQVIREQRRTRAWPASRWKVEGFFTKCPHWELGTPQASASGCIYQLTEASVLTASLHSDPPCPAPQLHYQVSDANPISQSSFFCFFFIVKKNPFLQWPKHCHLH